MNTDQILLQFADSLRLKGKSDMTIRAYMADVERFCRDTCPELPVVTREQLFTWDAAHAARKISPATRTRYRVSIRLFLRFLEDRFDVQTPAGEIGTIRKGMSDPKFPHPEDVQEILHNCVRLETREDGTHYENPVHARDAAVFTLLLATGVRLSECRSLNCGSVSKRKVLHEGKIITLWTVRISGVKPRHRERDINFGRADDITDVTTRHFGLWYLNRLQRLGGYQAARNYPLFATDDDDARRLATITIQRIVKSVPRRAGRKDIADWIHPHSLRHFFGTYFKANKGDLLTIQRQMGHANPVTTQQYIHLSEKVTAGEFLKSHPLRDIIAKPVEQLDNKTLGLIINHLIPNAA